MGEKVTLDSGTVKAPSSSMATDVDRHSLTPSVTETTGTIVTHTSHSRTSEHLSVQGSYKAGTSKQELPVASECVTLSSGDSAAAISLVHPSSSSVPDLNTTMDTNANTDDTERPRSSQKKERYVLKLPSAEELDQDMDLRPLENAFAAHASSRVRRGGLKIVGLLKEEQAKHGRIPRKVIIALGILLLQRAGATVTYEDDDGNTIDCEDVSLVCGCTN